MEAPIPHLGNPIDQSLRMYVVTLHKFDDADGFYEDMETPSGNLYIPKRAVDCIDRLPISRNTNYMLTYDEAAEIMNDPRVLAVELNPEDLGLVKGTCGFSQYSSKFDKTVASDATDINWGLLRCLRKTDIIDWGINGTAQQAAEIISDSSGKNVDVVIMDDGTPYPSVLEYRQNTDGTGYARMVEYNWFQHTPEVSGGAAGNYQYIANRKQEHGGHTSGTVAGNTQGWARDANIYNIKFADTNGIQYVRMFHRYKPVNPLTGVKNPTVMNNSWGWSRTALSAANVSQMTIRGVTYTPTSGTAGAYVWDANVIQNIARLRVSVAPPSVNAATDADMIDAMNEGVIIVASAGNSYFYEDVPSGIDYNNTIVSSGTTYYIHRGASPGSSWGLTENSRAICSGAVGQHNETAGQSLYTATGIETVDYKAEYSNYGPRIDCYAPGSGIQSVWNSTATLYDSTIATDPRVAALGLTDTVNNNFKKCPGTSMSGPQTAGVLACIAEKYPRMTQADARAYINNVSQATIFSTNGGANDGKDAGFTFNATSVKPMLFLQGTRMPSAEVGGYYSTPFPEVVNWYRPATGQVYPRRKMTQTANPAATFALSSNVATVSNGGIVTFTLTTTNVPDGTDVQYIITGNSSGTTASETGYSAVAYTNAAVAVISTQPHVSTQITTFNPTAGTFTNITNAILGAGSLTASTPSVPGALAFTGTADDGYWTVPIPFTVNFLGGTYNTVYVGTNSYITFGSGSVLYTGLGASTPAVSKIMVSAGDNSCQRIYYGSSGSAPLRTFRIRFEGHVVATGGVVGSPTLEFEVVFYENNSQQIDLHVGTNNRWTIIATGYSFDYTHVSAPLVGTLTVNNNLASLPVTITSTSQILLTARLGIFPTPSVNVTVN